MGQTPSRNVRVEDEIWTPAAAIAKANGENLSVVIRRALIQYVQRNKASFTAEMVEAGAEPTAISDGAGGGHFVIPLGDSTANRTVKEQS